MTTPEPGAPRAGAPGSGAEGVDIPVVIKDNRKIDPATGEPRRRDPQDIDEVTRPEAEASEGQDTPDTEDAGGAPAGDAGDRPGDPLAEAQAQAADLQDQLARRNADIYNLQEEYTRYVRRSKAEAGEHRQAGVQSVAEALMGVLDDLALAREHGDLTGPLAAIADKFENTLSGQFGIQRYGAVGEEFDPMVHEALMHSTDPDATASTVVTVIQPGYRMGERVLRAARVAVSSPE